MAGAYLAGAVVSVFHAAFNHLLLSAPDDVQRVDDVQQHSQPMAAVACWCSTSAVLQMWTSVG